MLKYTLKRYLLPVYLIIFCLPLFPNVSHAEHQKTRIAVFPFQMQGNDFETNELGTIVSEWFITAFVQNGRFEVVERKLLAEVMEEHQIVEAGLVSEETAAELGKFLGAQVIVSGMVMKVRGTIEVNTRIIDTENTSIITAEIIKSTSEGKLHDLVNEAVTNIANEFPIEGFVLSRDGKKVLIDLGQNAGIHPGMFVTVTCDGDVIKHPVTKEIIIVKKKQIGLIKIEKVENKISEGVIIYKTDNESIEYGNTVKSISKIPSLTIVPEPDDAVVRIINRNIQYYPGVTLPPGDYMVEVSREGFETKRELVNLTAKNNIQFKVKLKPFGPNEKEIFTEQYTRMRFIKVAEGCFDMGCGDWSTNCENDEKPLHKVCLDGFYIGEFEVTQDQWSRIMGNNPSKFKQGGNYPIEQVTWYDIQDYIHKLNKKSGLNFRLPTEAEWEYACRSGGKKETFCGGNTVAPYSWYKSNSNNTTHPVGIKSPNGLGIYDMSGNVFEWVQDRFNDNDEYYKQSPSKNPIGSLTGSYRGLRGGAWDYAAEGVQSSRRSGLWADGLGSNIGFRLILPLH